MTDTAPFWPYALTAVLFTVAFLALPLLVAAVDRFHRHRATRHVPPQPRAGSTPRRLEGQHRP